MSQATPSTPVLDDPRAVEILDIVAKESGVDRARLLPEVSIESLGIASLDMVQAIFEIESRFDVEIPVAANDSSGEFGTVGDLLRHVLGAIDRQAAEDEAGKAKGGTPDTGTSGA